MSDDLVPGMDAQPHTPRRVAERPRRRTLRWTIGILGVITLVLGGLVAGVMFLASNALNQATSGRGGSPVGVFVPLPLSNEDSGLVNVLIAGNSYDDPQHGGAALTDSIMVATINVRTNRTSLLSIPRDLWVDHNGRQSKINAVYVYAGAGDAGMTALSTVVERVTGLHIDQHVLVGYQAVRDIVDAVGGVDVFIDSPDPRGIADVGIKLPNGPAHLNGEQALRLARARNSDGTGPTIYGLPGGDFDRQANQRMLVSAVVQKARSTPALANPAAVLAIFDTIGKNVHTDLNASQLRRFYDLIKDGPAQSVSLRGDGPSLLVGYRGPDGSDALVPAAGQYEYGPIREYVQRVVRV